MQVEFVDKAFAVHLDKSSILPSLSKGLGIKTYTAWSWCKILTHTHPSNTNDAKSKEQVKKCGTENRSISNNSLPHLAMA
jgi:hypothetical protein